MCYIISVLFRLAIDLYAIGLLCRGIYRYHKKCIAFLSFCNVDFLARLYHANMKCLCDQRSALKQMMYTKFSSKKGRDLLVFITLPSNQTANQLVKTLIRKSVDFIHMQLISKAVQLAWQKWQDRMVVPKMIARRHVP